MKFLEMPILCGRLQGYTGPTHVPMSLLSERWAQENHSQSLQRLAERGGLDPTEMAANLYRREWRPVPKHLCQADLERAIKLRKEALIEARCRVEFSVCHKDEGWLLDVTCGEKQVSVQIQGPCVLAASREALQRDDVQQVFAEVLRCS